MRELFLLDAQGITSVALFDDDDPGRNAVKDARKFSGQKVHLLPAEFDPLKIPNGSGKTEIEDLLPLRLLERFYAEYPALEPEERTIRGDLTRVVVAGPDKEVAAEWIDQHASFEDMEKIVYVICIMRQGGTLTSDGVALLGALRDELAPVVVVSLGTNDPQDDPVAFQAHVEKAVRIAGARRCIVWSNVWLGGPNKAFNDVLRDVARRHPRFRVADWVGLIEERAKHLALDGVHGSPEGYARKAEEIARIVEECYPRLTAAGQTP